MEKQDSAYLFVMAIIVAVLFSMIVATELAGECTRTYLICENGPIETASAIGYLAVLLEMLARGGWDYLKNHGYIFILVAALGLRELDFDKNFTTMGIFKSRFYFSPAVSPAEKIIGFLVILILLRCIFVLVKKHFRTFLAGVAKEVVPMSAGISIFFMFLSKSIDGLPRKLSSLGIYLSPRISAFSESIEEIVELGIPLMLLVSAIAFFNSTKKSTQYDERV